MSPQERFKRNLPARDEIDIEYRLRSLILDSHLEFQKEQTPTYCATDKLTERILAKFYLEEK